MKAQIVNSLEHHASDTSPERAPKAYQASFLLAQCHFNGFGTPAQDDTKGVECLFKAARLGHTAAQEVVVPICKSIGIDIEDPTTEGCAEAQQWLTNSINSGSRIAARTLLDFIGQNSDGYDEEKTKIVKERADVVVLKPDATKYTIQPSASVDEILAFVEEDPDRVWNMGSDGDGLIHWAAAYGFDSLVEVLIEKLPSIVHEENIMKETPLLLACRHGHKSTVELLLKSGAKRDCISATGETPLHWLVAFSDNMIEEIGSLLMDEKAIKSYAIANTASTGHFADTFVAGTPLHRATALRRLKLMEFLLKNSADPFGPGEIFFDIDTLAALGFERPDDPYYLPSHWALQAHDVETLFLFFEERPNGPLPTWPSFIQLEGQIFFEPDMPKKTISDYLLPIGFSSLRKDKSEFFKAFKNRLFKQDDGLGCPIGISQSLLGYACEPFSRFFRLALHGAKQKLALQLTFQLLLEGCKGHIVEKVTYTGRTAIMVAVVNNDTETTVHLLERPDVRKTLEISYQGGWGLKPLHIAAYQNNHKVVRALLDAGADLRAERLDHTSALHVIASQYFPDQEIASLLIEKAPDLVSRKARYDSPFSTAVRNHDFTLATLFLAKGADPDQLLGTHETNTVLFQVTASVDEKAVEYLLKIPDINFVVAPQGKYTALHAAVILRVRYDAFGAVLAPLTQNTILELCLSKWHSKQELLARDIKGMTALQYAAICRDLYSMKVLVPAMEKAGADINTLSDFFGSPVHYSTLDFLLTRKQVPDAVTEKGPAAVKQYEDLTTELERYLRAHGAKPRVEILEKKWDSFSFVEKQKAKFLSSELLKPLVLFTEVLNVWRKLGPDVRSETRRIEQERNPEEVAPWWSA